MVLLSNVLNRAVLRFLQGILMACALSFSHVSLSENTPVNCAAELDATVALASHPDNDVQTLEARFAALENVCPAFAQMAHNQGVLAARDNRWRQAITHFQRSLSKDSRAASTQAHLQQIFKYRAANAYAEVLKTPPAAPLPTLELQDSAVHNSDINQSFPEQLQLRDIATVEYELFAWWQSRQNWTGIRGHYVDGFDIEAIKLARGQHSKLSWQDMKREIAFTENDAVVVISEPAKPHSLLLLRLVGNRWKIYQETRL